MASPVAVVVDGHSSGTFLVREFAEREVPCIHIQTGDYGASAIAEDRRYVRKYDWRTQSELIESELSALDICAVVPGLEGRGVNVADELASKLGVPGNDYASTDQRRDKALMAEAIAAHSVRSIPHGAGASADDLVAAWTTWGKPQAIVKPTRSAGSEDVTPCGTEAELRAAVAQILGKTNACEEQNAFAMVQPRIVGTEYVVNAVSRDGLHCVTDIWNCKKELGPTGTPVDIYSDLVSRDSQVGDMLAGYLADVLDALQISWGASHAEIIVDEDGPVLVEVGARLMGGSFDHNYLRSSGAYSQLELTVDAFVAPERFGKAAQTPYALVEDVRTVDFRPHRSGEILDINIALLRSLTSYRNHYIHCHVGDVLEPPIDRNTHIGFANLANRDRAVLDADFESLRRIENDMFVTAPLSPADAGL